MKAISLRLDENILNDLKNTARIFNVGYTELIKEGIELILQQKHEYPLYKLINNIESMPIEEENEITNEINSMSKEDLEIVEREIIDL